MLVSVPIKEMRRIVLINALYMGWKADFVNIGQRQANHTGELFWAFM